MNETILETLSEKEEESHRIMTHSTSTTVNSFHKDGSKKKSSTKSSNNKTCSTNITQFDEQVNSLLSLNERFNFSQDHSNKESSLGTIFCPR